MKVQESRRTETGLATIYFFFLFETGSRVDREGHKLKRVAKDVELLIFLPLHPKCWV